MKHTELRKLRERLGLTQQALAAELAVSIHALRKWETGPEEGTYGGPARHNRIPESIARLARYIERDHKAQPVAAPTE